MNEALVTRWNGVVGPQDVVYHLGDVFWLPSGEAKALRGRLNGRICLVRGNHDRTADSFKTCFEWVKDYCELKVEDEDAAGRKQLIVLCHYAMRVWNRSHYGAWHLFGHSHGTLPDIAGGLASDVGVDCHDSTPIPYQKVKAIMQARRKASGDARAPCICGEGGDDAVEDGARQPVSS
jgi:calcineurin-like phosphoesterase family protein